MNTEKEKIKQNEKNIREEENEYVNEVRRLHDGELKNLKKMI